MRKFLLICITVALSGATFAQKGLTVQDTRGGKLFDELGISLALACNNHIYERTHPVYDEGNEKKMILTLLNRVLPLNLLAS